MNKKTPGERIFLAWYLAGHLVVFLGLSKISTAAHFAKYPLYAVWGLGILCLWLGKPSFLKLPRHPANTPMLTLALYFCISIFFHPSKYLFREAEVLSFITISIIIYIGSCFVKRYEKICLFFIINICTLLSIYGILQYLDKDFLSGWNSRDAISTFANQNFFGQFLVAIIPITAGFMLLARNLANPIYWGTSLAIQLAALVITCYRTGYLAIILILVLSLFYACFFHFQKLKSLSFKISILLAIVFVVTLTANTSGFRSISVYSQLKTIFESVEITESFRTITWRGTMDMVLASPLIGHGAGLFINYYPLYDVGTETGQYKDSRTKQTHNEYLQTASELGIIGVGIIIWIFVSGWTLMMRDRKSELNVFKVLSWAGIFFTAVFSFTFHLPTPLALALMLLAWSSPVDFQYEYSYRSLRTAFVIVVSLFVCVIFMKPFVADIEYNYGNAYKLQNAFLDAEQHYKKSINLQPTHSDARNNLGLALIQQSKYEEAMRQYETIKKLSPYSFYCRVNYAVEFLRKNELGNAFIESRAGLKLSPHHEKIIELYKYILNRYEAEKR